MARASEFLPTAEVGMIANHCLNQDFVIQLLGFVFQLDIDELRLQVSQAHFDVMPTTCYIPRKPPQPFKLSPLPFGNEFAETQTDNKFSERMAGISMQRQVADGS